MFGQYLPSAARADKTALSISLPPASRQFYACIEDPQWEDLLQSLARPAPHLETLALVVVDSEELPADIDEEEEQAPLFYLEHYLLPNTLFNGHAPCLRKLDLNDCTFGLSWPILQNLTELRVSSVDRIDAVPVQE